MQELIKINKRVIGEEETNSVNARDLHKALEIKKAFTDWIKTQINRAGLRENVDYIQINKKAVNNNATIKDYIITTDASKHIAMMSQGAKAKEVRDYFIAVEKEYKAQQVPHAEIFMQFMQDQQAHNATVLKLLAVMQEQILKQQQKQIANALTPDQLDKIKIGVMRATKPLAEAHNFSWGEATRKVYTELNGRMGVFSYYQIAPADYDEAIALLGRMKKQKEELLATGEVKTMLSVDVKAEVAS